MISKILHDPELPFEWIDVVAPTAEDYQLLSEKYDLHPAAVKDCLSPSHLPKYERIGDTAFIITRIHDESSINEADTIQRLTNKVAIFVSETFLITIHRKDEPFIGEVKGHWQHAGQLTNSSQAHLLNQLLSRILHTYDGALDQSDAELDRLEKRIFVDSKDPAIIKKLYVLKRRASVFKRMLLLTKETLQQFARFADVQDPFTQDLIDTVDSLFFNADELHENVSNLLNLHLSLASHRTNEVMGVLTIVSMLFLPLTFIVGLYGMNFQYMPELEYRYGYFWVIGVMILLAAGFYVFFRRKGWL